MEIRFHHLSEDKKANNSKNTYICCIQVLPLVKKCVIYRGEKELNTQGDFLAIEPVKQAEVSEIIYIYT